MQMTRSRMQDNFLLYDAKNNNCQDLIMNLLESAHILDEKSIAFVKQDTSTISDKKAALAKRVTDPATRAWNAAAHAFV